MRLCKRSLYRDWRSRVMTDVCPNGTQSRAVHVLDVSSETLAIYATMNHETTPIGSQSQQRTIRPLTRPRVTHWKRNLQSKPKQASRAGQMMRSAACYPSKTLNWNQILQVLRTTKCMGLQIRLPRVSPHLVGGHQTITNCLQFLAFMISRIASKQSQTSTLPTCSMLTRRVMSTTCSTTF